MTEANKNLLTRLATAVVMVPLMLAMLYKAPPVVFYLFVLLATIVGGVEFFKMTHPDDRIAQAIGVLTCIGVSVTLYFFADEPRALVAMALGVPLVAVLAPLWRLGEIETAALRTCAGAFGPLWLGGLSLLARFLAERGAPVGAGLIILSLAIGWIADTAGYFAGRFLGKHKLYPAVSPKKTVEGAVGAVLGATLSPVVAHFTVLPSLPLGPGIALGLIAGTIGQMGDLGESLLKRSTGIKDSGAIVPGHGGILDRVDAVLLVTPLVYLFSRFLMLPNRASLLYPGGMRLASCLLLASLLLACSSDDSSGNPAGTSGTSGSNAGGSNAGGSSSGGSDAGGSDAGGANSGGTDAGGTDAGGSDAGGSDAGGTDAGGSSAGGSAQAGAGGAVAPTTAGAFDPEPFGGDRPVDLYVPKGFVPGEPLPLVILLHGYGASGLLQESLFSLKKVANDRRFLYMHPDGTLDGTGKRYWNATNACCGFGVSTTDDVAYLTGLVDEVQKRYAVDPKRIHFLGHSNGGFMSYRMACELGDRIAGIASLAGATFDDPADCKPKAPVSVLQIHGTADELVLYNGGMFYGQTFPSANKTVELWSQYDGCSGAPTEGAPIDVEPSLDGKETTVKTYGGCKSNASVELWSIQGGKHIPGLTDDFRFGVIDFLLAHPRP